MSAYPSGTVTLLFTDIEGSTLLLRRLGERYGDVLSAHRRVLRDAFERSDGHEIDTQGDSFLAAFARARDALQAAVDAQRSLAGEGWQADGEVRVRMGIHTGEPAVGDEGYFGLDVHRAARICAAAHGGQIVLSQTTHELATDVLPAETQLEDLGEHQLKDLPRPEHLFQLVVPGLRSSFPPLRTLDQQATRHPFLGRERELASLTRQAVIAATDRIASPFARHRRPRHRGFADFGWDVRALLASAPQPLQASLNALGGDLFTLGRAAVDYERYLASVDPKLLHARLGEYREMAVVSKRASAEADALERRLREFEALGELRQPLADLAAETEAVLRRLQRNLDSGAVDAMRADVEALSARVRATEQELHTPLEQVRMGLGDLGVALHRTRVRGVYRVGSRYVVPFFNEVGIEEQRQFSSLDEAHSFRRSIRLAESKPEEEWVEGTMTGMRQWGGEQGLVPPRRGKR
jgi:class 3 adenylate cyclase